MSKFNNLLLEHSVSMPRWCWYYLIFFTWKKNECTGYPTSIWRITRETRLVQRNFPFIGVLRRWSSFVLDSAAI